MTRVLFDSHSGLRYVVLAAGVAAMAYLAWALVSRRGFGRGSRVVTAAFTGLLDLQILLGLLLFLFEFPPRGAWIVHAAVMVAAAAVAHTVAVVNKRRPEARRSNGLALAGVVVTLALIVAGILAPGRPLLGR
jgi:hypothetical protein